MKIIIETNDDTIEDAVASLQVIHTLDPEKLAEYGEWLKGIVIEVTEGPVTRTVFKWEP